jgi:hypothetical protein
MLKNAPMFKNMGVKNRGGGGGAAAAAALGGGAGRGKSAILRAQVVISYFMSLLCENSFNIRLEIISTL